MGCVIEPRKLIRGNPGFGTEHGSRAWIPSADLVWYGAIMRAAFLALGLLLSQVPLVVLPCVPGDSTVACKCKQGTPAACAELAKANPEALKGILRLAAMAQAAQETGKATEVEKAQAIDSTGCGSGQDPNEKQECTGQWHHIISKTVWYALENHAVLRGKYTYRDPRFVARGKDPNAHCGYQDWHRAIDKEIRAWLETNRRATAEQFEAFLRELHARPEMRARFPDGL